MAKFKRVKQQRISAEDIKSFRENQKVAKQITALLDESKTTFKEYANSVGFEEDSKVIIERGSEKVTVTEVISIKVADDALDTIENKRKFKKYADCIETVEMLNEKKLMDRLYEDIEAGKLTEEDAKLLLKETKSYRVN